MFRLQNLLTIFTLYVSVISSLLLANELDDLEQLVGCNVEVSGSSYGVLPEIT